MKVLQLTAVDFTAKKFLLPLVNEMIEQDYDVHIACNISKIGNELIEDGYVVHHIPFSRNMNILHHCKSLLKLIKLIKSEQYDIIHSHTPIASLIGRLAAKVSGTSLKVYTAHGFYFHENMNWGAYKIAFLIEKFWGRYFTDYIFFQSKEDYNLALDEKFQKTNQLVHISNGVSTERFDPKLYNRNELRYSLGIQEEQKVIIFIGRLVKEKGIEELLEAFPLVLEAIPEAVLVIVGGFVTGDRDGFDIDRKLKKLPEKVNNKVLALGLRDDVPELLNAADLFVLPSYREGLPRSIIEAMAMSKPIVATNIRGCREEVFPHVNGLLCKDRDSADLAKSIIYILQNKDRMNEFGKNSRKIFEQQFDEKVVLQKQMNIFNRFREAKNSNV